MANFEAFRWKISLMTSLKIGRSDDLAKHHPHPRVMDEIHSNEFSTEKVLKSTKKY